MDPVTTFLISITTSCAFSVSGPPQVKGVDDLTLRMTGQPYVNMRMSISSDKETPVSQLSASCTLPKGLLLGDYALFEVPRPTPDTELLGKTRRDVPKPRQHSWSCTAIEYWGSAKEVPEGQPLVIETHSAPIVESDEPEPSEPPKEPEKKDVAPKVPLTVSSVYGWWSSSQDKLSKEAKTTGIYQLATGFGCSATVKLTDQQNFLAPIEIIKPVQMNFDKPIVVQWKPVENAIGYIVEVKDGKNVGSHLTAVRWTSSAVRQPPTALMNEPLSAKQISQYLGSGVLLPAKATKCTIPAKIFAKFESPQLLITAIGNDMIQMQNGVEIKVMLRSSVSMALRSNVKPEDIKDEDEKTEDSELEGVPVKEDKVDLVIPAN